MRVYSDSQLSTRMAGFHFVMKFSERLEKLVSYLPLFLVFGILGWGYYAFVVIYCLKSFQFWKEKGDTANLLWTALATIWFHVNMFLVVYSYGRCAFSDPGYLQEDIEDETETENPSEDPEDHIVQLSENEDNKLTSLSDLMKIPRIKFAPNECRKCSLLRPERSHHCSICNKCVLKMDHHCVWVNNCVGVKNYKFFILFLLYVALIGFTTAISLVRWMFLDYVLKNQYLKLSGGQSMHLMIVFIVAIVFGLGLLAFGITHINFVLQNLTTLESFDRAMKNENPYNVGKRANWEQVFGRKPLLWFLPIANGTADGIHYQKRAELEGLISA